MEGLCKETRKVDCFRTMYVGGLSLIGDRASSLQKIVDFVTQVTTILSNNFSTSASPAAGEKKAFIRCQWEPQFLTLRLSAT